MPVTITQVLCLTGVVIMCLALVVLGKKLRLKRACTVRARVSLLP